MAKISYKERSHTVSPKVGTCTCTFQQILLMPCRHIFKYRDYCGDVMFEPSLVANRWLKSYQCHVGMPFPPTNDSYEDVSHASSCFASVSSTANLSSSLSQSQKYRKIHSITDKLAFCASQCGMAEFCDKYATLETVLRFWENNSTFAIVPTEDNTTCTEGDRKHSIDDLDATNSPSLDDPASVIVDDVVNQVTNAVLLPGNNSTDNVHLMSNSSVARGDTNFDVLPVSTNPSNGVLPVSTNASDGVLPVSTNASDGVFPVNINSTDDVCLVSKSDVSPDNANGPTISVGLSDNLDGSTSKSVKEKKVINYVC